MASWMQDILIFSAAFLAVAAVFWMLTRGAQDSKMKKRLARVKNRQHAAVASAATDAASLRRKTGDASLPLVSKLLAVLPTLNKLRDRLERSGKKITAEKYCLVSALLFAAVVMCVQLFFNKPFILGVLIAIVLAVGIPHFLVGRWITKRTKAFLRVFPDSLDLIVRGLRSGLPVAESIKLVAKEVPDPVASVFQRMADTMKLGVPLDKILSATAKKLRITEFDFFVTSIILQRETGGNLSEILNNLSEVLRKRFMMKMKIKAMTSEARASTVIVGSLPFIVMAAVRFMSPDYLDPLFNDYRGNIAAGGALLSLCMGVFIMNRMASFEI